MCFQDKKDKLEVYNVSREGLKKTGWVVTEDSKYDFYQSPSCINATNIMLCQVETGRSEAEGDLDQAELLLIPGPLPELRHRPAALQQDDQTALVFFNIIIFKCNLKLCIMYYLYFLAKMFYHYWTSELIQHLTQLLMKLIAGLLSFETCSSLSTLSAVPSSAH